MYCDFIDRNRDGDEGMGSMAEQAIAVDPESGRQNSAREYTRFRVI